MEVSEDFEVEKFPWQQTTPKNQRWCYFLCSSQIKVAQVKKIAAKTFGYLGVDFSSSLSVPEIQLSPVNTYKWLCSCN